MVQPDGVALITPTTIGFREAMRNEDVVFEMPLKVDQESNSANAWLKSVIAQESKIAMTYLYLSSAATLHLLNYLNNNYQVPTQKL